MTTFRYGANVWANEVRQHYLRFGEGAPLVLVPGITSPAITWGFVAERFGRHFDTYVMDVRGRGLSSSGPDLDYGIDACADDILAFAAALGLERYVLVGHSMGARFAIRAARRNPDHISKLVLVDPPVSGPGRRAYPSSLAWYVDSLRMARQAASIDDTRRFCPTWTDDQLRLRAEWLPTCSEEAVVAAYRGFHEDDIHADLPHVRPPTLLVLATRGDVVTPADEDEIRRLVPHWQVARVPGAGHMIPWDDYEGFFRAFGNFLGRELQ